MATDIGSSIGNVFSGGKGVLMTSVLVLVVGGIALIILAIGAWFWFVRRRWNLKVEFKLVRSAGKIINGEWGKGYIDNKRGICYVKRKGWLMPKIKLKVFDIRRYLQGVDLLTVIQVGSDDYRLVLNDSWTEHLVEYEELDDNGKPTGEVKEVKESILNIKIDTGLNKAWRSAAEAAAKKAYSLGSFFSQFQTPIAIGIVIICCFVGFAILWVRIGA